MSCPYSFNFWMRSCSSLASLSFSSSVIPSRGEVSSFAGPPVITSNLIGRKGRVNWAESRLTLTACTLQYPNPLHHSSKLIGQERYPHLANLWTSINQQLSRTQCTSLVVTLKGCGHEHGNGRGLNYLPFSLQSIKRNSAETSSAAM